MIRALVTLASLVVLLPAFADASGRYDPRLRFRTIATPRFDIHYHQGEDAEARRLAAIAERVAADLDKTLGPASGRVQVILVDQTDLPNGWATPLPYNTIEIVAARPSADSSLGNTDDWLRLVFTHEYTHIVHLSRGAGWIGGLRRVFGRNPLLYPNVYLPIWQIEGIAVHEESGLTGQGRVPAADFRAIINVASAASRVDAIDRVGGGLIAWPSGQAPYIYGAYFHEFLAKTYGEDSIRRLTDTTAGYVPYFGSLAFRKVFKRSLGRLWEDYARDVASSATIPEQTATRLTHHGFSVSGPRFDRRGTLYYSVVNPHGFPSLLALAPGESTPHKVIDRYLGSATSPSGITLVYDQMDVVRHVGLQSDLYLWDRKDGYHRRLTHGARAADPDVAPDGTRILCTIQRADRRELATMTFDAVTSPLGPIETLVSEPGVSFASPRWSPDGTVILAERGRNEIVVIDVAAKRVIATIASSPKGRVMTPAWTTDGSVLFASDAEGAAFRIYRAKRNGEVARLEGTGPDARSPELAPDGRTLAFVGYTADGHDVFSLPTEGATWTAVKGVFTSNPPSSTVARNPSSSDPGATTPTRTYSPWRTVLPQFWTPVVEVDDEEIVVGAATGSVDALGRHAYAVQAGWAPTRAAVRGSSKGRPDVRASYAYDRWWPTLFASVSDDTDAFRDGDVRSREANAGVILPFRQVRWSQSWLGAYHASQDRYACSTCGSGGREEIRRGALRGGWFLSTARAYGYSISLEEGWRASVTTELARRGLGGDGDGGAATMDVRGYLPVAPRHGVVAARIAVASSWGDRRVRRLFSASGNGPQPGGFSFGSQAIGLIRGFDSDDIVGRRAFVVNADYRVPLMRLERGAGTLPIFARTLHGALFADAGHAWDSSFRRRDIQTVVGAEISMDVVLGYRLPLTITAGTGWGSNGKGVVSFGRVGRAF